MIDADILQLIPQRHPFVMIDALLFADDNTTQTSFTISDENIFCDDNTFSEAGLLENIAQTAAAGAGFNAKQKNNKAEAGYIASVKNFEVLFLPKLKDELITEVVITNHLMNVTFITGKILCNNQLIARCEMKIFIDSNH